MTILEYGDYECPYCRGAARDVNEMLARYPDTVRFVFRNFPIVQLHPHAEQAAEAGGLVVVSIPVKAFGEVPVKPLAGKPVLDTGNYYPQRDGHIAELDTGALTSSGLLQRSLPGAQVVKVFNNIFFKHLASLARAHGAPDRSALPIAGDSAAAGVPISSSNGP